MIGRTLGRYRILEKLGEGSMGQVWKAADTRLSRSVALKLLHESLLTSTDARRRFLREATAACKLDHPAIATVFDADEADGAVMIVYQLVEGETLAQRINRNPLPIGEAAQLALQAARGLAHAHAKGVLHRDISSRNLMVTPDSRLKIVDFGLAQVEEMSRVTSTNSLIGTAGYIAPEVIQNQRWDERSDIYALGTVLYEMLTGKLPFPGPSLEAQIYAKLNRDPEPPSTHRPEVTHGLDELVLKTLERDPRDRVQSADQLAAELKGLEGEATPAEGRRVSVKLARLRRAWRGTRRNRARMTATVVAAAFLVALTATLLPRLSGWLQPGSATYRSVAVLPLMNVSEDSGESDYRAAGLCDALIGKLAGLSELNVLPWRTTQRYSDITMPLPEIARELGVDALVTGTFREEYDGTWVTLSVVDTSGFQAWGQPFESETGDFIGLVSNIAVDVAGFLKGSLDVPETQSMEAPVASDRDAYDLYMQGAFALGRGDRVATDDALVYFDRAVQLDPSLAEAHIGIGAAHSRRYFLGWEGGYAGLHEAESHFQQALQLNPESIAARRGLIRVYWEKGQNERSLEIGAQLSALKAGNAENLQARGEAYLLGGLPKKAIPLLRRALDFEPTNEGVLWYLTFGTAWAGNYRDAIINGDTFIRRFGADPEIHLWVGFSYHNLDVPDSARIHYGESVRLFGDESNHYSLLLAGCFLNEIGEADSARSLWNRGRRALERLLRAYPDNTRMRVMLAGFYAYLGDKERFHAIEDTLLHNEPILGFPSMSRFYLASGHALFDDIKRAASILESMPQDDHGEWVALDPGFSRALGTSQLLLHPDFVETRRQLTRRYESLNERF